MGLDGGTYITRSDILRGQSWDVANADGTRSTRGGAVGPSTTFRKKQLDVQAARETKWSSCALSSQPLRPPLVADFLGSLFTREAVLEFLLGRSGAFADAEAEHRYANQLREAGGAFEHLQSRKDVFTLHLTARQAGGSAADTATPSGYVCPITDLAAGRGPFVALPACGHALSERALRQVADGACPVCGASYEAEDAVPLNGTPEQVADLRRGLQARQAARQATTKGKKRRFVFLDV
ncbi:hypothetical protein WJX81_005424 [Elliptochloris bilobata]|uniref:Replication termination factor 2 n=1 Tax=Elliptochloris bilobata TaxID=381761 RepID=A0AAW1RRE0_9CHLO